MIREDRDRRISRDVVDRLYEEARALEPKARTAFVGAATRGALHLRDEVLSLLESSEAAEEFFERLSKTMPVPAVDSSSVALSTGQVVGHYRILEPIGAGGMGTVYRAHDTRLDRDVALKFLPSHLTTSGAQDRLLLEARAVAAVEHPNICTVYEVGESRDERSFIAMALCQGQTLQERLARGPLPVNEAVAIAAQIARGLEAAHARGIVHRDVKPGNVVLTDNGTVKLLDFGLAATASPAVTRSGPTPGTVAYMSPEQARGDRLDQRTDLWSLGVILYEMLSGVRPFRAGSDGALLQAILHQNPEPVSTLRPDTPDALSRVVDRLLEKEPERRYGNAGELLADLERTASPDVPAVAFRPNRRPQATTRRVTLGAAGALAGLALLLGIRSIRDSDAIVPLADSTGAAPAIAVLPFSVHGAGLEIWREGMVALLSTGLDGAGGLRAIDSRTVLARWSEEIGDERADLPHALGVARRTQARYALVGSVVAAGPQLRVVAELYDLESGRPIGNALAEGSPDSVLSLVDRLGTEALRVVFEEAPEGLPTIDLASVTTGSLPALKAYLDGEVRFRRSDFLGAIEAWERAVAADTLFALGYYWLGEAYGWDEGGNPASYFEMLDRASRLADRLPARERSLVRARRLRQWSFDAIAILEELVREYPDDAEVWYELGEGYYHASGNMRGPEEAERAFRRAAELQPSSAPLRAHLLDLAFGWRPDSARIANELEAFGRMAPRSRRTVAGRIALGLAFGGPDARSLARAALDTLDSETAGLTYSFLRHPRFVSERETVYGAVRSRLRDGDLPMLWRFMDVGAGTGRVREALGGLDDPLMPLNVRGCGPLRLSTLGLPVPDAILEAVLSTSRADTSAFRNASWVACAAKYAAARGHWGEHQRFLSHARDLAAAALAAGDTAGARRWDQTVLDAKAFALWRQGRKADALASFQNLLARHVQAEWVLWDVGQLATEVDRLDVAERAYERLWLEPLAYLNLGRIYERTNRPVEARQAYELFALAWRDADPELQPLVQEARRAITRLRRAEDSTYGWGGHGSA